MKWITLYFTFFLVGCSPLMEYNNQMRLNYQEGITNNQHNLIIKSLSSNNSAEAVIAADLYAIEKCKSIDGSVPTITKRQITPKSLSDHKTVNQTYKCISPTSLQKRRIAALVTIHCSKKNLNEDIRYLCDKGIPN
ncbi:MAG: hypothetical protein ACJAS4_003613 [Bacteriovoracaceae bacterium]|jgi:hypothetical protein